MVIPNGYEAAMTSMWTGTCDVVVLTQQLNEENGRTEDVESTTQKDIPCRLSFSSSPTTGESNEAFPVSQVTKLFLSKDVDIPPGSKIVVTQNGVTFEFARSGDPAVYSIHQEITVEKFKEWA